jgi:hypothetical protein
MDCRFAVNVLKTGVNRILQAFRSLAEILVHSLSLQTTNVCEAKFRAIAVATVRFFSFVDN